MSEMNKTQNFNILSTKEYSDIIKNPDCLFTKEDIDKQFYYFCFCSESAYFPICESCALSCHSEHNPQIKIQGYFTCNCGLKNHHISERSQIRYEEKSKFKRKCFYSEFYNTSYHKGYYNLPSGKKLCSVCFFSDCNPDKNIENPENLLDSNLQQICECENHQEINVVTLKNELNKKVALNLHMLNFNFNIISICPTLKEIFITFLNEKLKELVFIDEQKKLLENSKKNSHIQGVSQSSFILKINDKKDPFIVFYTDFVIFTLFNIFKKFKKSYSSQYLHVKNIFEAEIKPNHLISILGNTVNFQRLLDFNENIKLYFITKANFAFLIFHVYIKGHFLNFNNLLNLKSLLNLNIVQRVLYIHQSKKFYRFNLYAQKFSNKKVDKIDPSDIPLYDFNQKLENWESFTNEFASAIVNIIDTMLQVNDNEPIIHNIMCGVMTTLNRIMKFLIKYNLIDDDLKSKFFELMEDTLVAFVNQLDDDKSEYDNIVWHNGYDMNLENRPHEEVIAAFEKAGKLDIVDELNALYLKNETTRNNIWFVLPVVKCVFYNLLKKNDDLVIMKLKGKFSKTTSKEKYCFVSSNDSDTMSKIFILCIKLFNENCYKNKNEESVYKKKILKFDLYVKKILELMNGNNEFYLKSLESVMFNFKRKLDSIFIQDMGTEKNNPDAYINLLKSSKFAENNKSNKIYNKINMKILISNEDIHMDILRNLNMKIFIDFNNINVDFGNLNKKFYEYDINFKQFTEDANLILERFKSFFSGLNIKIGKSKNKNHLNLDSGLDFPESQSFLISERQKNTENNGGNNDSLINNINFNMDLLIKEKDLLSNNNTSYKQLNDFKQLVRYTDFLENFNEFLDIYSRSKEFDKELNAINIKYDLLKFILNLLYIIADDNTENLVLIMTINPIKLVDSFFEYREELCILLNRLSTTVSKFDYNDNFFFLTDFINSLISKLEITENGGMSKENFAVFTSILKSFKKLLPKYNIYNNELINTFEIINNKIIQFKNNEKMMNDITNYINNLFPNARDQSINNSSNSLNDLKSDNNSDKINEIQVNSENKMFYNENKSSNDNINQDSQNPGEKMILKDNVINNFDMSVESINGTLLIKNPKSNFPDSYLYQTFLKNYFALLNISFEKDLYYFDYFYDKDILIFNKTQLKEVINNSKNINISFREEIEKFLHNYNLKSKIKFSSVEREFSKYQEKSNTEKANIKYIFSAKYKDALNFSCELLVKQMEKFFDNCNLNKNSIHNKNSKKNSSVFNNSLSYISKLSQGHAEMESLVKINAIFSYLENSIISPLYKIVNMFMIDKEKLLGEDYFTVYMMILYLHKLLVLLYNLPILKEDLKNKNDQKNNYVKISNYNYGDIKFNLTEGNVEYLTENLTKIQNLKYFQFEESVNIFRVTLAMIKKNNTFNFIHLRKKFYRFHVIENSYLGCYDENSKDGIFVNFYNDIVKEAYDYFLNSEERLLYDLIEEYKKNLSETFGNEFSLIKSLDSTDLDAEVNLSKILFDYLINKWADKLTRANQDQFIPQNIYTFDVKYKTSGDMGKTKKEEIHKRKDYRNFVEGKYLKLQNCYVLFYLRNLFFFNPEKFQETLEYSFQKEILPKEISEEQENTQEFLTEENNMDGEKFHYFLSIINKYFIFGNLLCESSKLFELYNERTLLRSNFMYDLIITNIFLMQNICEGHNQELQEFMFDLRLKPMVKIIKPQDIQQELNSLQMPQASEGEMGATNKNFNENEEEKRIDKEKERINSFLKSRSDFPYSYTNFLSNLMRNIISCLYFDFDNRYIFLNKTFSLNSNFICIYNKLTDLCIEMIQGTKENNLFNFYAPGKEKDILPTSDNIDEFKDYQFLILLNDVKEVFVKDVDDPDKELSIIKTLTFRIINNILNQETVNQDFVRMLLGIFNIEFLVGKMSRYMKKLIVRFDQGILYEHPQFSQIIKKIFLKNLNFQDFYKIFLTNDELPEDDYFKLCVQIYYFINIIGDKFLMQEAINILELDQEDDTNKNNGTEENIFNLSLNTGDLEIENTIFLKSNKLENKIKLFFEKTLSKKVVYKRKSPNKNITGNNPNKANELNTTATKIHTGVDTKDLQIKTTPLNDILYTKQFYSKIVQSIEFVINDYNGCLVKEIYFIKNPIGYLINKTNIDKFLVNANRTDATTKITSLLDSIENFQIEIAFKLKIQNRLKRFLLRYDYKITDLVSFILALIINLILLFGLTSANMNDTLLRAPIFDSVFGLGIAQILFNTVTLIIFLIIKYPLWISYRLNEIRKTEFSHMGNSIVDNDIILYKINFFRRLNVYLLDCIFFNEDVSLIILNIILGAIGISEFYASFVFSLQLITCVRFVDTIRDIVIAFKSRFDQLMTMVLFSLFLIYFYTNIGFFFLNNEYSGRGLGHGGTGGSENVCNSLIRCFLFHFNEGIRNGGGIGDSLDLKSWEDVGLFFGRWILDMIFFISVILLLLNMINGIIVSTFSAIREESEQKADDEENRCFICSIDKSEFEKRKLSFESHIKNEHNVKDYINFIIYLKLTANKDLDSNQGYIKDCINNRDINVFPIYQSKSLGTGIFDKSNE